MSKSFFKGYTMEIFQISLDTRRGILLIGLLVGIFLAAIDSTVVAIAMPNIVSSLRGLEVYS
ncbi:MAG: hypothetical protein ABDH32_03635 [Candidatus Caldarchaeales archaeon]